MASLYRYFASKAEIDKNRSELVIDVAEIGFPILCHGGGNMITAAIRQSHTKTLLPNE